MNMPDISFEEALEMLPCVLIVLDNAEEILRIDKNIFVSFVEKVFLTCPTAKFLATSKLSLEPYLQTLFTSCEKSETVPDDVKEF
jgi:hypothetical protein